MQFMPLTHFFPCAYHALQIVLEVRGSPYSLTLIDLPGAFPCYYLLLGSWKLTHFEVDARLYSHQCCHFPYNDT